VVVVYGGLRGSNITETPLSQPPSIHGFAGTNGSPYEMMASLERAEHVEYEKMASLERISYQSHG